MNSAMSGEWYAVRVRPNFEHVALEALTTKGHEAFLPTFHQQRSWAEGTKSCVLPLFLGYLFCRMQAEHWLAVLQTPGVRDVVSFGRTPVPIPEEEIEAIRHLTQSNVKLEPHPYSPAGQVVRVEQGPLAGIAGLLDQSCGIPKLLLSITLLQKSVSAELDTSWTYSAVLNLAQHLSCCANL
jgi:transcription antitermination factor NusG